MPGNCDSFDNEYETVPLPPVAVGKLSDTDLLVPYSRTTSLVAPNDGDEFVATVIFTATVAVSPSESVAVNVNVRCATGVPGATPEIELPAAEYLSDPGSCAVLDRAWVSVPLPPVAVGRLNDTDLLVPYSRTTSVTSKDGDVSVATVIFTVSLALSPSESVAVNVNDCSRTGSPGVVPAIALEPAEYARVPGRFDTFDNE